ncbi:MAG: hypothetical protein LBE22_05130 [Azoarcus sp.]|jgi:hypothetical protein|nr:hypothetical protein [Azoarcus sp.]
MNLTPTKHLQPLDILNRICDAAVERDEISTMDAVQLFWRKQWIIEEVPDPQEKDPLRYAIMASFLERMAEVWSDPPKNMPSKPPQWCAKVPPTEEFFSLLPERYRSILEKYPPAEAFRKRNIFALENYVFFV